MAWGWELGELGIACSAFCLPSPGSDLAQALDIHSLLGVHCGGCLSLGPSYHRSCHGLGAHSLVLLAQKLRSGCTGEIGPEQSLPWPGQC